VTEPWNHGLIAWNHPQVALFQVGKNYTPILAILIGNRWENDDMPWILLKENPLIN
jgi:hypothetical protein